MPNESPQAGASSAKNEVLAQKESNRSAMPHFASFSTHREELTSRICAAAAADGSGRLCVLGAGNCYDLDLPRVTAAYREVHLVDIDDVAVTEARARQEPSVRERLFNHAPVDLLGLVDKLDRWRDLQVTREEALAQPDVAAEAIAAALPGPFDVVVSACLLTQIQLVALNVLTAQHPLFEGVRQIVNLTHLRSLAKLTRVGGTALLVTDFVTNQMHPLDEIGPQDDLNALTHQLVTQGKVIFVAHPGLITWSGAEDPVLKRSVVMSPPRDPWVWHNGPDNTFLVYALEMTRVDQG